jgi:hypothetical protein
VLRPKLWTNAILLGLFTVFQVFLGFGSFIFTRQLPQTDVPRTGAVLFTAAHQTLGAVILATSLILTLRTRRLFVKK